MLISHIPLARENQECGPLREKGTIRPGRGLGYENTLGRDATDFLLDQLKPSAVFRWVRQCIIAHHSVHHSSFPVATITTTASTTTKSLRPTAGLQSGRFQSSPSPWQWVFGDQAFSFFRLFHNRMRTPAEYSKPTRMCLVSFRISSQFIYPFMPLSPCYLSCRYCCQMLCHVRRVSTIAEVILGTSSNTTFRSLCPQSRQDNPFQFADNRIAPYCFLCIFTAVTTSAPRTDGGFGSQVVYKTPWRQPLFL